MGPDSTPRYGSASPCTFLGSELMLTGLLTGSGWACISELYRGLAEGELQFLVLKKRPTPASFHVMAVLDMQMWRKLYPHAGVSCALDEKPSEATRRPEVPKVGATWHDLDEQSLAHQGQLPVVTQRGYAPETRRSPHI
jgi:hypothetical protein